MDSSAMGIIIAIVVNIGVSAFGAGKLWQKVADLCKWFTRLEKGMENTDAHLDRLAEKVGRVEGMLEGQRREA